MLNLLNVASCADTLNEVVSLFRSQQVIGCIVTKVDEAVNPEMAFEIAKRDHLAVNYITDGSQAPDDLYLASARRK